jgi:hypothetical protein
MARFLYNDDGRSAGAGQAAYRDPGAGLLSNEDIAGAVSNYAGKRGNPGAVIEGVAAKAIAGITAADLNDYLSGKNTDPQRVLSALQDLARRYDEKKFTAPKNQSADDFAETVRKKLSLAGDLSGANKQIREGVAGLIKERAGSQQVTPVHKVDWKPPAGGTGTGGTGTSTGTGTGGTGTGTGGTGTDNRQVIPKGGGLQEPIPNPNPPAGTAPKMPKGSHYAEAAKKLFLSLPKAQQSSWIAWYRKHMATERGQKFVFEHLVKTKGVDKNVEWDDYLNWARGGEVNDFSSVYNRGKAGQQQYQGEMGGIKLEKPRVGSGPQSVASIKDKVSRLPAPFTEKDKSRIINAAARVPDGDIGRILQGINFEGTGDEEKWKEQQIRQILGGGWASEEKSPNQQEAAWRESWGVEPKPNDPWHKITGRVKARKEAKAAAKKEPYKEPTQAELVRMGEEGIKLAGGPSGKAPDSDYDNPPDVKPAPGFADGGYVEGNKKPAYREGLKFAEGLS